MRATCKLDAGFLLAAVVMISLAEHAALKGGATSKSDSVRRFLLVVGESDFAMGHVVPSLTGRRRQGAFEVAEASWLMSVETRMGLE